MALSIFISLSILLSTYARFAARFIHFFETVFTVSISIVFYFVYFCIAALNLRIFVPSERLGSYCCFLIMGFVAVPAVVLISFGMSGWRSSLLWKGIVWLGSAGVLLGLEAIAVRGKAIVYLEWSIPKSFVVWVLLLAVLHGFVLLYRRVLREEVQLP